MSCTFIFFNQKTGLVNACFKILLFKENIQESDLFKLIKRAKNKITNDFRDEKNRKKNHEKQNV